MNQLSFTSGLLDASNYPLTISNGAVPVTGASSNSYIVTGDGVTSTGVLNINNIPSNTSTILPVGTATYYLPATINPGANTGNSYSAFVFQGATTDATANGPAFSPGILSKMLNAEWNINRTTGSGNAALTLDWTSSGTNLEGTAFQGYGLNIGISQYSGGSWQMATGNGNVSTNTATSTFNSFSQFNVVGESIVLPVQLSDFTAVLKNDQTVLLSWFTSGESNIMDFDVQKSVDGLTWNTIGSVKAKDHLSTGSYSFIDAIPATGVNYYRLFIHNTDALTDYSTVRMVSITSIAGVSVFPNPANNIVHISVDNADAETNIMLINSMGQILASLQTDHPGNSVTSLNVHNYPAGVYMVRVGSRDKLLKTNIVVISR